MTRNRWLKHTSVSLIVLLVLTTTPAAPTYAANVIRAAPDGFTNPECGLDWASPCTLSGALGKAMAGDEIWVMAGHYHPGVAGAVNATFLIPAGVALYGGFSGTELQRHERDWIAHPTILSGDIDDNDLDPDGDGIANHWTDIQGENTHNVVRFDPHVAPIGPDTIIDGFTITAGQGISGAGMTCTLESVWANDPACSPTLTRLIFSGNYAEGSGGGLLITNNNYPTLNHATFVGNHAGWLGGGIAGFGEFGHSGLTGSELTFTNNSAGNGGAGIALSGHKGGPDFSLTTVTFSQHPDSVIKGVVYKGSVQLTVTGASFDSNQNGVVWSWADYGTIRMTFADASFTNNQGGVFYGEGSLGNPYPSLPEPRGVTYAITNAAFSGNHATAAGGILHCTSRNLRAYCTASLNNVRITGNRSEDDGGAIYLGAADEAISSVDLRSATLSNNQAAGSGGAIASYAEVGATSLLSITNSILWGNGASTGPEVVYDGPGTAPVLSHCLVAGWANDDDAHVWGDRDPRFVSPAAAAPPTTLGDYRLQISSRAIDAGDNAGVITGITTDLDDNPRFVDVATVMDTGSGMPPIVDMGAYETADTTAPTPTPPTAPGTTPTPPAPLQSPDLSLEQTLSPALALPGQPVTFTFSFTNTGALTATQVVLIAFPPEVLSPSAPQQWELGTLSPGAAGKRTLTGVVSPTLSFNTIVTGVATITSDVGDVNLDDNHTKTPLRITTPRVQFSAANYFVREDEGSAHITVTLSTANPYAPVHVDYATADETATEDVSYTPVSGTLTLPAGELFATFSVPVADNGQQQGYEHVQLILGNPVGGALGTLATAILRIGDPGAPPPVIPRLFLPLVYRQTAIAQARDKPWRQQPGR